MSNFPPNRDLTPFESQMPALADCIQPLLMAHRRLASDLADLCREVNHEVYLVGGAVRDALLGRAVHDMDLTLAADGLALGRKLADRLRCPFVPLDDTDRTGRVVLRRGFTIDISSFKGDGLETDLRKRDFTINAMALRLADVLDGQGSLVDPLGGAADLAAGRLQAVSEASFRDDPLRILRAFRLAGQFNLDITPETAAWIEACDQDLHRVSGERLLYELALILGARPHGGPGIRHGPVRRVPVPLSRLDGTAGAGADPVPRTDGPAHRPGCFPRGPRTLRPSA